MAVSILKCTIIPLLFQYNLLLIYFLATKVEAFVPDRLLGIVGPLGRFHTTMTESALAQVSQGYFNKLQQIHHKPALTTTDVSDMFKTVYGDSRAAAYYRDALRDIKKAVAEVDSNKKTKKNPAHHCDAERMHDANKKIVDNFNLIIILLNGGQFDAARKTFGNTLHILQDFYSHSNWVEIGETEPNYAFGIPGKEKEIGNIADKNVATCVDCDQTLSSEARSDILKAITAGGMFVKLAGGDADNVYECKNNIKNHSELLLTSGYSINQHDDNGTVVLKPEKVGKCSHGGILDRTSGYFATGGINKDSTNLLFSPHHHLHHQAAAIAENATVFWINQLRSSLNNDTLFGQFLQLNAGSSLAFAIDISASMKDYVSKIKKKINDIVDSYSKEQQSIKPSIFILLTFTDSLVNEPIKIDNIGLFKHVLDGLTIDKSSTGATRKIYEALEVLSLESVIGGHMFALTNGNPNDAKPAATYRRLQDNIHRKQLTLDIFVDEQIGRRRRRSVDVVDDDNNPLMLLQHIAQRSGGNLFITRISASSNDDSSIFAKSRHIRDDNAGSDTDNVVVELAKNQTNEDSDGLSQFGVVSRFQQMAILLKFQLAGDGSFYKRFYIDNTVTKFTVIITSQHAIPDEFIITDAAGNNATAEEVVEKSNMVAIETYNAKIKGPWFIWIADNHKQPFSVEIRADSLLLTDILFHKLYDDADSDHPGTNELRSAPIIGTQVIVEIDIIQSGDNITQLIPYTLQLLDPKLPRDYGRYTATLADDRPNTILATIDKVPAAMFLISITGYDGDGHYFRRIKQEIFEPSYVGIDVNPTTTNGQLLSAELRPGGELELEATITNYATSPTLVAISVQDTKHFVKSFQPEGALLLSSKSISINIKLVANETVPLGSVSEFQVVVLGNTALYTNIYYDNIIVV